MTKVLPRKAWIYGAAERIHCTNARVVAECDAGLIRGMRGIGSKVAWQQARPIITPDGAGAAAWQIGIAYNYSLRGTRA